MLCPACGHDGPDAARFCPACGQALATTADQRRVVTVLFADLVGFTTLSEATDPEHVKNMVDRCFERLAADVMAFGGKVDKIIGDAMVALFGAPVAHEDDAERAVRGALQMQHTLDAYCREANIEVRMRVGVNTGEVLVGALRVGDDYTAMGDVVNVAQRLEQAAEPGHVVVGPGTYTATSAVIGYAPLGRLEVKGRGEPVEAWVAQEALAPPGYRPRRFRTPLIGRDSEFGLLAHALVATVDRHRPHLVLISGDAGVGKSRLAEELARLALREHEAAVYVGRCVPYGEANPWWPVAEVLRQAFGIEVTDSAEVAFDKSWRGVQLALRLDDDVEQTGGAGVVVRVVDGLLYLMGFEAALGNVEPSRALDEAIRDLGAVLEGIAARRPVVVFLADIHWADPQVLTLVDNLLERLHGMRVMLVTTARPELQERWAPKPGRYNSLLIQLDPLDDDATGELVAALFAGQAPDDLRELLRARSGGNPFFVEELASLLADAGVLGDAGGAGRAVGELPATLRGLVAARLDSVDARERSLLEDAAVVGGGGAVSVLVGLGEARGEHDITSLIDQLEVKGLLVVEDGKVEFKSDLVREVAYETLTKSERARRHAALAAWLEHRARDTSRQDEYLEQLAHHYAVAARLADELGGVEGIADDLRERALEWIERAAVRAEQRDYGRPAEQFFDQALALSRPDDAERRRRLLLGRARARAALHELVAARADAEAAACDADEAGDVATKIRVLTVLGEVQQKEGDGEGAVATLDEAIRLATEVGDTPARAEALRAWGMTKLFSGDVDAADGAAGEALAASRELGDRRGEAWALQQLAWIAFTRGDSDLADARLAESASTFEELSDWGGRSWARGLLGFVRLTQGCLEEAGALADEVAADAERSGDRWAYGMTLVLQSSVALWLGNTGRAAERAQMAVVVFDEIDDDYGRSIALGNLTRASACLGRMAEARSHLADATAAFDRHGGMGLTSTILAGNLDCHVGDPLPALARFEAVGETAGPSEMAVVKALALVEAGRPADAIPLAERVLEQEGQGPGPGPGGEGACTYAAAVLALACAGAGRTDDAVRHARSVEGRRIGTYLDRTYAALAAGLAGAQRGERGEALEVLDAAVQRIDATEDRLTQAIVRLARGVALEVLGDAGSGEALAEARAVFAAMGVDPYGWDTAFRQAATGQLQSETTADRRA